MSRGDLYQVSLISLGVAATALLGYFLYQEIFPEYKIYQDDYIALEKFRSSYTGEAPPEFKVGVKQIVLLRDDKGPPTIDRCVSCHVALQFEHFSPTVVSHDENGKPKLDTQGNPLQVENNNYVWARLDARILELRKEGNNSLADEYEALKTAQVGHYVYDVTKVLRMHPLMGRETRPFEFHPIDEYGCVSCHNGNGRGLTTEKAHGPVFDGAYETEFMGYTPSFLEKDPQNDPSFSKVFNHKPGPELLFQTTPIYVGALMQARCIQCHQSAVNTLMDSTNASPLSFLTQKEIAHQKTAVDLLTANFQQGKSLFISQACYACHRISGLSRGGIGPELTREGYSYPWFIKESIVWPQADLKTSTMPNFQLDHREIEDLLTFLLAQTGENLADSPFSYKTAIQEWDNGKKLPWEKAITPTQVQDLNYSMTVFAAEGCAACHRLKGFNSDVGYAVEKGQSKDYDALYKEKQWFRSLIPEEIVGSELAAIVEKHAEEIDQRIARGVREKGILNAIDQSYPQTLESYYSNFSFASRKEKSAEWKDRLQRVLMIYIQEYGLGRLVGPRPNWSGVYRSDEWLMEHFKNPASHVPRSIMPVFPFDDTKFYALTHMLDVLGIRNRNADKEIWNHKGFNPEMAYQQYCSQCHGPNLQGNGPVAEWIYPVPKNLRNSDFLRQLTREHVIQSITHGVQGTPMPPWGEVASDKPSADGIPVLNADEIESLVNWLYSGLPGGQVIRASEDVPKWKYSPDDVIRDLKQEGNFDKFKKSEDNSIKSIPSAVTLLAPLDKFSHYYAALTPQVSPENEIFNITAPPVPGPEKYGYYIKEKYYTPENLASGKAFFELNCAACHGRDADGTGLRAGAMVEAKPRMLVNFDWINTRDDLRLIRSIKYGVPGTAMTPWGDQTNSLQRLQLVMFIRTLSEDKKEKRFIDEALYSTFDRGDQQLEIMRGSEYVPLDKVKMELEDIQSKKGALFEKVVEGEQPSPEILALVEKELSLVGKLNLLKARDQLLIDLKTNLKSERELYFTLGMSVSQLHPSDQILAAFDSMVKSLQPRFAAENGTIKDLITDKNEEEAQKYSQVLLEWTKTKLAGLQKEQTEAEGKMASQEKQELLSSLKQSIEAYTKVQKQILKTEQEGRRFRLKQHEIINSYNAKNKS